MIRIKPPVTAPRNVTKPVTPPPPAASVTRPVTAGKSNAQRQAEWRARQKARRADIWADFAETVAADG